MQVMCPMFLHFLTQQACKRPRRDEELVASLVLAYHMESHCPQPVPLGSLKLTLKKLFVGSLPTGSWPHVVHLPPDAAGAGPTSTTIWPNCLMGEDPGDIPAISSPLNCSAHLATPPLMVAIFLGVPTWVTILQPALSVTFVLTIWNKAVTN